MPGGHAHGHGYLRRLWTGQLAVGAGRAQCARVAPRLLLREKWVGGSGQEKVCVPEIGLKFPAPSIDFIFCLRKIFLMCVGGGFGPLGLARAPKQAEGRGDGRNKGGQPTAARGNTLWRLHNPCRLGGPQHFNAGDRIRSGPQMGGGMNACGTPLHTHLHQPQTTAPHACEPIHPQSPGDPDAPPPPPRPLCTAAHIKSGRATGST